MNYRFMQNEEKKNQKTKNSGKFAMPKTLLFLATCLVQH